MQPFNVIRLSLYQGRGMVIGGRPGGATGNISGGGGKGVADVPAKPWMGFQNYGYLLSPPCTYSMSCITVYRASTHTYVCVCDMICNAT